MNAPSNRWLGVACGVGAGAMWGMVFLAPKATPDASPALMSWSAYAVFNSRWLDRLPQVSAHDWSLLTGVVTGGLSLGLAVLVLFDPPHWAVADWGLFAGVSAAVAFGASSPAQRPGARAGGGGRAVGFAPGKRWVQKVQF